MGIFKHNTLIPVFLLTKTNNILCYDGLHESVAMGKSLAGHIPSSKTVTDLMTKVLLGQRQKYLVSNIHYEIHDDSWAPVTQ